MPGRKKPSALLRMKKLATENELRSCEVAGENTLHVGEKPPEADSDVPPSLHRQEHTPSTASTSDEKAVIDNRVPGPVDGNDSEVIEMRDAADKDNISVNRRLEVK